jgi:hypothetical protein
MAETQLQKWIEENAPEPSPAEPVLTQLTAVSNGEYRPSAGVDGFDLVTVSTPILRLFTSTGTLSDPFGDRYGTMKSKLVKIDTFRLEIDGTVLGVGTLFCERNYMTSSSTRLRFEYASLTGNTATSAALYVEYNIEGSAPVLLTCYAYMNGSMTDMSTYAPALPTTVYANYLE